MSPAAESQPSQPTSGTRSAASARSAAGSRSTAGTRSAASARPTRAQPVRVLLVDDHPVVRAGLRAILESFADVTVVAEANSGEAALAALGFAAPEGSPAADSDNSPAAAGVDAVVIDLQMPGIGGAETIRRMRAAGGPEALVLTTYDTEADIVSAVAAGALGYLLKDAPEDELHSAVLATAAGRRTLSPEVAAALAQRVSAPHEALSARETEILTALETGASNQAIAKQLYISLATVKTHLLHIYRKLDVDNRTAAIAEARARKLI